MDTVAVKPSYSTVPSKSSTPEATLLVATQPYNLSQCSLPTSPPDLEANQLVAGCQAPRSITFKSSPHEAELLLAGSPVSCSLPTSPPNLEANQLVAGCQAPRSTTFKSSSHEAALQSAYPPAASLFQFPYTRGTTSKSSLTEADLLVAGSQDSCSTTSKSSLTEADLLVAGSQDSCSTT